MTETLRVFLCRWAGCDINEVVTAHSRNEARAVFAATYGEPYLDARCRVARPVNKAGEKLVSELIATGVVAVHEMVDERGARGLRLLELGSPERCMKCGLGEFEDVVESHLNENGLCQECQNSESDT